MISALPLRHARDTELTHTREEVQAFKTGTLRPATASLEEQVSGMVAGEVTSLFPSIYSIGLLPEKLALPSFLLKRRSRSRYRGGPVRGRVS
jgi:hypothetical protein